jgi:hypothetical protein
LSNLVSVIKIGNMRIRCTILAGFLLLALAAASSPQTNNRSAVLPESVARELARYLSYPGFPHFDGTWMPAEADVRTMESRLSRITQLGRQGGNRDKRMEHPERFYRQYVGIMVGKHKFIYINAFCDDPPPSRWKQRLVEVSDGGACFWNVNYDTVSGEFSFLQINGYA